MAGEKQTMTGKTKLPINMSSKYQKKCPICRAPMVSKCLNCGYINQKGEKEQQHCLKRARDKQ